MPKANSHTKHPSCNRFQHVETLKWQLINTHRQFINFWPLSVVNRTQAQMREEKQNLMMLHPSCNTTVSPAHERVPMNQDKATWVVSLLPHSQSIQALSFIKWNALITSFNTLMCFVLPKNLYQQLKSPHFLMIISYFISCYNQTDVSHYRRLVTSLTVS
jgi:hypothetical protein